MSAVVGDLIRNLVVIVFLNVLLEMLLPQGEFHRYIRLITGLIVILMVVGTIAALTGRLSRLEPVAVPEAGAGEGAAALRGDEDVSAAYSRQVLQQCRSVLESMIEKEVAASGQWRLEEANVILEEDYRSSSFGTPLRVELRVKAAGAGEGRVTPVSIAEVAVGPPDKPAEGSSPGPHPLPELERSLAGLLGLSPQQVTATLGE